VNPAVDRPPASSPPARRPVPCGSAACHSAACHSAKLRLCEGVMDLLGEQDVAKRLASPPPGGAAWRRTRPFRLRRSRRPIRSLQRPGEKHTRGHRGGAWSPRGAAPGQDQLGGPEYVPSNSGVCRPATPFSPASGVFTQCSCRSASIQRHHGIRLVRLVGAPRPPLAHRPTVGPVIGPETGAVGRRPVRSRPRPRDILRSRGSWPGQTGPRPGSVTPDGP
jgi:hypothetical protein